MLKTGIRYTLEILFVISAMYLLQPQGKYMVIGMIMLLSFRSLSDIVKIKLNGY